VGDIGKLVGADVELLGKDFPISRLAEKDLPLPGVPRIRPLGFLSRGTFQGMGKIRQEKPRGRLKAVFGGR